jgi:hypothetical protein
MTPRECRAEQAKLDRLARSPDSREHGVRLKLLPFLIGVTARSGFLAESAASHPGRLSRKWGQLVTTPQISRWDHV